MATTAIELAKRNNLQLIDPNSDDMLGVDNIVKDYGMVQASGDNPFSLGLKMANGIALLTAALNDNVMATVMTLQGRPLGFKTDKDNTGGYPMPVVRDAVIEALMRGVNTVGNEFNIISGRCYITKEGFGTLLAKIPGLRYVMTAGIPKMVQGGAETTVKVEWMIKGEKNCETLTFPIRVNSGMGADAINGKAIRKARAWLYNRITGFDLADADLDDELSQGGNSAVAESRFSAVKKGKANTAPKVENAPKKDAQTIEAEVIDLATSEPNEKGESNLPPTLDEQYPRLSQALRERNAPVTVQDIQNWHLAYKIAINEDSVLAQLDRCVSECLNWMEAQRQGQQG